MIKNIEEFYKFLDDCTNRRHRRQCVSESCNIEVNVIKFQNNFSNLVKFKTNITLVRYSYYSYGNYISLQTTNKNHSELNYLIYNSNLKLIYSKETGLGGFKIFVYTEENKESILKLFNQIRKDNVEDVIKRLVKIQNNYSKLIMEV